MSVGTGADSRSRDEGGLQKFRTSEYTLRVRYSAPSIVANSECTDESQTSESQTRHSLVSAWVAQDSRRHVSARRSTERLCGAALVSARVKR
eukprot:9958048-Alexandrium_andersonii.AAC.1